MDFTKDRIICVVGLGYVGMPLAKAFSKHLKVIGFDINMKKLEELKTIYNDANLELTGDPSKIKKADFILICVPTPVTRSKDPDLKYIKSSAEIVGRNLKKGATVVLESTVYPGVTEDIMMPILERESSLVCGKDFKIGYSPERINPSDDAHKLDKITKVVAGMDTETTDKLAQLYGLITTVFAAKDIKTAEAAKVIENIQRDINIALMNELTLIFHRMGLDMLAILDAASTKWNFMKLTPGLVGGHCIPVDPYYLVYKAKELDYHPQIILAGRAINDFMPKYVAEMALKGMNEVGKVLKGSKVLIMGLTYKENVSDTRESPVKEMVKELKEFRVNIFGYDPHLSKEEIEQFGVTAFDGLYEKVDCVIVAVAHEEFKKMPVKDVISFMNAGPVLIDVKGIYNIENAGIYYWRL